MKVIVVIEVTGHLLGQTTVLDVPMKAGYI